MSVVIEGRKAGQKQPKRPSIADDTIASISRLKALYLLSAGEVKGLANGAASIMLEGTPLVDDNGNPNFDGVEWEIRHGTVDQPHIAGMPSASNEIGVNVQLPSDTPYIRSISNTQLSSINVNISFPMLKKQKDNGDIVGVTVAYAIDVQTDGGGYVTMLNTSLTAKTSGRYQKTHNVKLPDAQSNWQIRVRKITADGNNETLFNSMQVDSIAEIIDAKLRYPCSALLYLSFDAKTFSNIPKLSVDMQGVYVQVPSNYDTVTRTSTGIWDGTFKQGYTTNPAWHYYDLITNKRYGLGDKIKPFMINKWALEHIARVCDEPVDDGKGGTEPRFTCNLYLQKAEDAYQVLQHIAGIFRGMSFWNGSQIVVDADTARDCEYVITRANVVGGAFVKTGSAASDRHTIAKVAWSNPDNAYETEYVMVRNEQAITEFGINILDLSAVGCTSEGQAYRMGLAALLAELNRTQTVSFAMGLDGELPAIGSRIDIADMMFTGANNGGRISSVSDNRQVITVDRDNVPAAVGDKLIVNLESGKAQERVITAISGRDITVAIAFDPVASQNVWAVNTAEMPTMPFIVMSAVQDDDGKQFNYTAMQYDPTIYSQIDNGTIIEQRPVIPGNNPYVIDAPDNVVITSRNRVEQGQNVSTLVIAWAQVKDAIAYDVEWRKDDGDWIKLPRTGNISAEIDGVYSGNYLARVRAVSAFDAISKPTTSILTAITGKAGAPPKLASLKATGLLFGMQLDWMFAPGSGDTAYTEIQVASAPNVNVATLGQFAYNTDTHTVSGLQGNLAQSYRGRIVDKLGNVSPWTPWVTATTDASADKVLDLVQGQINEGSLDGALTSKIDKIEVVERKLSEETATRIQDIIDTKKQADDAQRAADNAAQAATDAATAAGNKGEVIYQWQTPSAARQLPQNLWIDTNGGKNTPKRWDGTAWVVVTDKAATDAQAAADAAQAAADAADSKAVAAQSTADTAKDNAKTADDKAVAAQESATAALSSLTDISADNKLTAVEKKQVKLIFDDIQRVNADLLARAAKYDVGSSAYTTAYNALDSYISPKLTDMSATSIIVRTAFNSKFDDLFLKRADLNTAIVNAAKLVADTAQNTANDALDKANTANDNIVTILDEQIEINNELGLQYETLQGVILDYKPRYASKDRYASKTRGQNWTYWKTVARDNYATNQRITVLQSDVADSNAQITQSLETLTTKDTALAASIETLTATTVQNAAAINSEATARTTADSALTTRIDTVQSSTATAQSTAEQAISDAQSKADAAEAAATAVANAAQTAATNAASLAGNKGEVIYQWQTPAAARQLPQNLWIDTTGGKNTPKRWDGSAWVAVTDKAALDAQTAANTAQSTANDALSKANTATTNIATIQTELSAVTNESSATASAVETLQTTVDGNTSSIQTQQTSIDGLSAQSVLTLDVNGYVTGYGTYNDGKKGTFAVRADEFYIGSPNGSKELGFVHYETAQEINGVIVPEGTYLRDAYIANGTITSAKIGNAAITTAKIANLAVTSAQIDNLAVTTGKIADLAVDTLQIAEYAVTVPVTAYTEGLAYFGDTLDYVEVQSMTIPASMGYTNISINCTYLWNKSAGGVPSAGGQAIEAQVYKDGVPFGGIVQVHYSQGVGSNPRLGGTFSIQRIVPKQSTDAVISVRLRSAQPSYVYERHMIAMTVRK
ncbi:TipJ family phage tail tip protein [Psychrobacter pocilloporae]|uniref:TipJ family phage tail tip protein n=1 Tax=Psychrobacter pocilloporae TaxID=1775882 RepID=UPI003C2FA8CF